jgi:hypothetical protein
MRADFEEPPPTYAPGFEPPADVRVPWYAWVLWPMAVAAALLLCALIFRGCMAMLG